MYLDRISYIDQGDSNYNSVLTINPDCLFDAMTKDKEKEQGKAKGFLHGIPVLLKDNINTDGKMPTTAGSIALKNNYTHSDAFLVKRLKEEGAIILGKTNLTEFANFLTQDMRNGYSSLGGYVLNPYNPIEDPSGSSTGSAVAVSLNLAPIAVGTETGGSIMAPSMLNGVVGIKPTIGMVSRTGIIPISNTLDTAGPIAKSVTDAALMLSALRGNDSLDSITNLKEEFIVDYTQYLNDIRPNTLRVGIVKNNYDSLSDKRKEIFNSTVEKLRENGVSIIDNLEVPQTKKLFDIMLYEFKKNINYYLSTLNNNLEINSLTDLITFNRIHKKEALKYGQSVFEKVLYTTSGKCNEEKYLEAIHEKDKVKEQLIKILNDNNLDAIYFSNYTSVGPNCGFPTMTVPIGISENNVPIGCYLLSNHYNEDRLLKVAKTIEDLTKGRTNPIDK